MKKATQRFLVALFRFSASVELAVILILLLAGTLAIATFIESSYTTKVAQQIVYRSTWFALLLLILGINVAAAAIIRYPWKKHHIGFLITHVGILVLLAGSLQTQFRGFDGSLSLEEGSKGNTVLLDEMELKLLARDQGYHQIKKIPFTIWSREGEEGTKFDIDKGFTAVIDRYIPWANSETMLLPDPHGSPGLIFRLKGDMFDVHEKLSLEDRPKDEINFGPATVSLEILPDKSDVQKFFASTPPRKDNVVLVVTFNDGKEEKVSINKEGFPQVKNLSNGIVIRILRYIPHAIVEDKKLVNRSDAPVNPALEFFLQGEGFKEELHTVFAKFPDFPTLHGHKKSERILKAILIDNSTNEISGNRLAFGVGPNDVLYFKILSKGAVVKSGTVVLNTPVETTWMNVKFSVDRYEPKGIFSNRYFTAKLTPGAEPSQSAVRLHFTRDGIEKNIWVGGGTQVMDNVDGAQIELTYSSKTSNLPFDVELHDFEIKFDPGTKTPASFSSIVSIPGDSKVVNQKIWMNHPLVYKGYTFFQSSYAMVEGEPKVSVLQVTRDPGRILKYLGSILICLGIILLFWFRRWMQKPLKKKNKGN